MQYLPLVPYLLISAGIGLSYARVVPAMIGWIICALGVLSGLGVAIALLVTGKAWPLALVAALPLAVAIPMVIKDLRYPRINDVTTNVENPPVFVAALNATPNLDRDMSFPENNVSIVRERYPRVQPLFLEESQEQAYQHVEHAMKEQPTWEITHSDPAAGILEAEVTTSVFQFVDDVMVYISEQDGKARIDMRSKSRDGLVDAGANAKRIQSFFEQLTSRKASHN